MNEPGKDNLRHMVLQSQGRPVPNLGSRHRYVRNDSGFISPANSISIRGESTVNSANPKARQASKVKRHINRYAVTYAVQFFILLVFIGLVIGMIYA